MTLEACDAADVQVVSLDWACGGMVGEDGRLYREVRPGLWAHFAADGSIARPFEHLFVQTSFHGDGVFLRLLYRRTKEGWRNVSTGKLMDGLLSSVSVAEGSQEVMGS